jgi:hypothetical protein
MKSMKSPRTVTFQLTEEEMNLAGRLSKREKRDGAGSINLWAREVVRQYLHEFKVMPEAWSE